MQLNILNRLLMIHKFERTGNPTCPRRVSLVLTTKKHNYHVNLWSKK